MKRIDIDIINSFFEYTNDNIITSSCVSILNTTVYHIVSSAELSTPTKSALLSDLITSNTLLMKLTFWLM